MSKDNEHELLEVKLISSEGDKYYKKPLYSSVEIVEIPDEEVPPHVMAKIKKREEDHKRSFESKTCIDCKGTVDLRSMGNCYWCEKCIEKTLKRHDEWDKLTPEERRRRNKEAIDNYNKNNPDDPVKYD